MAVDDRAASSQPRLGGVDNRTAKYGHEIHERPFTVRGGKIRREAVDDGEPKSWGSVTDAFKNYVHDKKGLKKVFSGGIEPMSHRFSDQYARKKTGEIYGADRAIRRDYDNLRVALVTLKGYPWNENGHGRAPFDFLSELLESNNNVTSTFRRHFGRFARVTVLGAHKHGYPHVHHCLWIDSNESEDEIRLTLRSAVESHLRNSPVARREDHERGGGCIRIGTVDADADEPSWLGREAVSQLVGWGGVLDSTVGEMRFSSLLWASGRNQIRFGGDFRHFIEKSQDSAEGKDRGDFEGIQVESADGEIQTIPVDELDGGGGSPMVEVDGLPEELDPVSSEN